ncbi:MAG: N-acetylmuramoyl-L-alanine amidase, partial [Thermoleophilia bacterium]|nr:N-acetylmuramoyl-L-alanine amidase [Thermoleophilia bacterium]
GAHVSTVALRATGPNTFAPDSEVARFTLAGVQWRGPGRVFLRTRSSTGKWSQWHPGAPESEDGPDANSREATAPGWTAGNPLWVGPSNAIEARAIGRVSRIRAHLVWSPETRIPYRLPVAAVSPAIVPRLSWGADESIRRGPPTYAADVRFSIIHHTAGSNGYTRSEAPAIVKAIQLYHVQGNGWNDIGYNFLVDRFGTVYEGRFGGIDRNVVGAHALGFNTGSVGIALIGTYGSTQPSKAAQDAIARLVAWRLDLAHVDPTGFLTAISGGSERYASGIPVVLSAISGHRDTGFTECPGDALHAKLGHSRPRLERSVFPRSSSHGPTRAVLPFAFTPGSLLHSRGPSRWRPRQAWRWRVAQEPVPASTGPGTPQESRPALSPGRSAPAMRDRRPAFSGRAERRRRSRSSRPRLILRRSAPTRMRRPTRPFSPIA